MSIEQQLLAGEKVLFHTKKHFIIFVPAVVWSLIALFFVYRQPLTMPNLQGMTIFNLLANVSWLLIILALYSWASCLLTYLTSNFYVTSSRVIMREGFLFKHATETRLSAVAEIKIDQSLLGQVLNYGNLAVNSFGGGLEGFNQVAKPYEFQRQVLARKEMPA